MNINYLMGVLWIPWIVVTLIAFWPMRFRHAKILSENREEDSVDASHERFPVLDASADIAADDPEVPEFDPTFSTELMAWRPPSPWKLLTLKTFWIIYAVCVFMSTTWYIRNYVVTGNPVYAFFHEVFPGTKNVNPEVMESAQLEWFANGDGVNNAAILYTRDRFGEAGLNPNDANALDVEFSDRVAGFWLFFQGFDVRRLNEDTGKLDHGRWTDRLYYLAQLGNVEPPRHPDQRVRINADHAVPRNPHAWKFAPVFMGLFFPGLIIGLLLILFPRQSIESGLQPVHPRVQLTVFFGSLSIFACLAGYHFFVSDMYLYQVIPVIVPIAIIGAFTLNTIGSTLLKDTSIPVVILVLLWTGIISMITISPGLTMVLKNFKYKTPAVYGQETYHPLSLDVFRHPGMDPEVFYALEYGDDWRMWEEVNARYEVNSSNQLLTHDNRHLMYDPEITIVHLDDWSVQQIWDLPIEEKVDYFKDRDIPYYLRIPNEQKHPVLKKLGIDEMIDEGYLHLNVRFGGNELYAFDYDRTSIGSGEILENSEFILEILPEIDEDSEN